MNSALVVVIDRLGAGFLGPYGNTWIETPACNRLAAESALFEFALSDSPDLATVYRSYWSGWHALAGPQNANGLAGRAAAAGLHTALITDAAEVAALPLAAGFGEPVLLPVRDVSQPARAVSRTGLARLLASAAAWLERASEPFLLWVHSRGMAGAWDAPLEFRQQFADEEDPPPPEFVEPPERWVEPDEDPDVLLGIQQAYAGQVRLLDECLGGLLDVCQDRPVDRQPLLIFTSPRGYPLGEHRRVGAVDGAIYGEHLHVPCLIRYPDSWAATRRSHDLIQPASLHATLEHWLELPTSSDRGLAPDLTGLLARGADQESRAIDRACAISGGFQAVRTPAWFLHSHAAGGELFAKPDDRWEANEISDRCRELLPKLQEVFEEFRLAAQSGDRAGLSPLPEELLVGPR